MADIYTQEFLHHYKHQPYNRKLKKVTHTGRDVNTSCGDEVDVSIDVQNGIIKDIGYTVNGCIISSASMSIFSEYLMGKSIEEVQKLSSKKFIEILPVRLTPAREKCALVGYNAFINAVKK